MFESILAIIIGGPFLVLIVFLLIQEIKLYNKLK